MAVPTCRRRGDRFHRCHIQRVKPKRKDLDTFAFHGRRVHNRSGWSAKHVVLHTITEQQHHPWYPGTLNTLQQSVQSNEKAITHL